MVFGNRSRISRAFRFTISITPAPSLRATGAPDLGSATSVLPGTPAFAPNHTPSPALTTAPIPERPRPRRVVPDAPPPRPRRHRRRIRRKEQARPPPHQLLIQLLNHHP